MARSRDRSEVERLKGIIREQRSVIKALKKEAGRLNKRSHQYEDIEEKLAEHHLFEEEREKEEVEKTETTSKGQCPKCGEDLKEVAFGTYTYLFCTKGPRICKYRVRK